MNNRRKRAVFSQLLQRHLKGSRLHFNLSQCSSYTSNTDPLPTQTRKTTEVRQRKDFSIMPCHHTNACWSTIHLVKLAYKWECPLFHYMRYIHSIFSWLYVLLRTSSPMPAHPNKPQLLVFFTTLSVPFGVLTSILSSTSNAEESIFESLPPCFLAMK